MAVRRERVVLDLEGNFERNAAKDAAAIKLLKHEIDGLSGHAIRSHAPLNTASSDLDRLGRSAQRNGNEIDKMSGRLRIFADAAAVFGPSLFPLGAAGLGALAGFTNQLGMAASAAGVAVLAFHGVGDAVSALNKYHLAPTATNLASVNEKMAALAPAAQEFARSLSQMMPMVKRLQQSAAAGLFPGLTDALEVLASRGPEVNTIIAGLSSAMGELAKEGAEALASPKWDEFFDNFETTAKPTLIDMGHAMGNIAKTAADLWVALSPLTTDFSKGLVSATRDLERWASSLAGTEGFQDFLAYVEDSGPKVLHLLGQIGNMFVQVAQAVAPLGGPSMKIIGSLADAIANIADSDMGTPILAGVAALALFNRTMAISDKLMATTFGGSALVRMKAWGGGLRQVGADLSTSMTTLQFTAKDTERIAAANQRLGTSFKSFGKGAALVGAMSLATTDLGGKLHVAHAAMGAMIGMMAGPWGAAIGAAAGGAWDLGDAIMHIVGADDKYAAETARQAAKLSRQAAADERSHAAVLAAYAHGFILTSDAAKVAGQSVADFARQVDIANDRLSDRADLRGYQQALDDLSSSVAHNGRTLDINTQAGRDNQSALDSIASSALKVSENMHGLERIQFLKKARADFVDAAIKAGMTRDAAQKLADKLHLINGIRATPHVKIDGYAVAVAQIESIEGTLRALTHPRTIDVRIRKQESTLAGLVPEGGYPQRAGGGTVPGPRHPYGDKTLIMAAPGEEIITNRHGEADAFRADRAAGRIPAYAGGGTVGGPSLSGLSLADRTSALGIMQSIRDLVRELKDRNKKGRLTTRGIDRRYDKAQLASAKKELHDLLNGKEARQAAKQAAKQAAAERRRAEREVERSFTLTAGSMSDLDSQLSTFAHDVKHAGGTLGDGFGLLANRAKSVDSAWLATQYRLTKLGAALDAVTSKQSSLVSAVGSGLVHDPFASVPGTDAANPWAAGAAWTAGGMDPFGVLSSDTANANQFAALSQLLAGEGLSGDALASAQSHGLDALQYLANLPAQQVAQFEQMFDQRASSVAQATTVAAATYQPMVDALQTQITQQQAISADLAAKLGSIQAAIVASAEPIGKATGKYVGAAINDAAKKGHKKAKGAWQ